MMWSVAHDAPVIVEVFSQCIEVVAVGTGVAEWLPSTQSSRVVPERATPMMKMGVGPANVLDDSWRRLRPRRQVTLDPGMVVAISSRKRACISALPRTSACHVHHRGPGPPAPCNARIRKRPDRACPVPSRTRSLHQAICAATRRGAARRFRRSRASLPAARARRQPCREPMHLGTAPQGIGSEVAVCRDGCHYSRAISAMASKRALIRASSATRFARSAGSSAITITPSKKASTGACNCASRASAPA